MEKHKVAYLIFIAAFSIGIIVFTLDKDIPKPISVNPNVTQSFCENGDFSSNSDADSNDVTTTSPNVTTAVTTTTTAAFYTCVDLNSGTFEDFAAIPILSDEQAQAIIDLREKIHYFSHCYELLYADGFDEELVAELCQYVYVDNPQ